jgi:hypothetical protein
MNVSRGLAAACLIALLSVSPVKISAANGPYDAIHINELLAHSHADAPDWIELYNPGIEPLDIGLWYLSDDPNTLSKYRIAEGTVIEPNGYAVFYEDLHFGNHFDPGVNDPFALSENGEALYLSCSDGTDIVVATSVEFGASETAVSFGRHVKSTGAGDFVLMSEHTPGWANALPLVGPIVINEIMYRPAADDDAEYVELLNIGGESVTLLDANTGEPWRFTDSTGIAFSFPIDVPVTIEPGEYLVLARDAQLVRNIYGVPAAAAVLEWESGKLSNAGETVTLLKPGDMDAAGRRCWIERDRISYSDGSHGEGMPDGIDSWPPAADGTGLSLSRRFFALYGDDPNNWQAAIPTPGRIND